MPLPNSYGDFAGDIPLDADTYKSYSKSNDSIIPKIYDDNGKLIDEAVYMDLWVDGICDVKIVDINGRQCVEFAHYVWGFIHGNGIGFLITTLTWEDGKYKVLSQKCIPI